LREVAARSAHLLTAESFSSSGRIMTALGCTLIG
jgi:hypothetical protein